MRDWIKKLGEFPTPVVFVCPVCGRTYNKDRVMQKHLSRYHQ